MKGRASMPAEEDYETLQSLAERLKLEDDERERFVSSSMQRLGYKPKTSWDEPEGDEDGDKGGDFFSGRRQQRQSRDVRDKGRDGGRDRQRGQAWGYGN